MESHTIFNSKKFEFHESLVNGITIRKCTKDGCKAFVKLAPDGSEVSQYLDHLHKNTQSGNETLEQDCGIAHKIPISYKQNALHEDDESPFDDDKKMEASTEETEETMELRREGRRYVLSTVHSERIKAWCEVVDMSEYNEFLLDMFNLVAVVPGRYKKILRYMYLEPIYLVYLLDVLATKVVELFIKLPIRHAANELFEKAKYEARIDAQSPAYAKNLLWVSDSTKCRRPNFLVFKKQESLAINID